MRQLRSVAFAVPAIPESVGAARCHAREALASWPTAVDPETADSDSLLLLYTSLPAHADQCKVARRMVTSVLESWSKEQDTADAMASVLAELFANGLDHHSVTDGERLSISLTAKVGPSGQWLALSVTDGGGGSLRARPDSAQAEDGRGLMLVRGLGAKVTDEVLPAGYQVTAWLAENSDLRNRVCQCDCLAWGHQERNICKWTVADEDGVLREEADVRVANDHPVCVPCATDFERVTALLADGSSSQDSSQSWAGQGC